MPPVEYHLLNPPLPVPLPLAFLALPLFSLALLLFPPLLLPHPEVLIVGVCLRVREPTLFTTGCRGLHEELVGLADRTEAFLGLVLLMSCHLWVPS